LKGEKMNIGVILLIVGLVLAIGAFITNIMIMTRIIPTKDLFKSFGVGMIFFVLGGVLATVGFYLGAFSFVKETLLPLLQ
jgi:heme/copper-type cytochrome/quinol oxidase subunit 1